MSDTGSGGIGEIGVPGVADLVELGRTAAAATYRGIDQGSGRSVVVKVLEVAATPPVRARFDYDQGQIGSLLDHPSILAVHRHGYTADGRPWFVAEDATGGTMADRVGALDGPGVLALGIALAGALESAHRLEVVHGDLRPEDIMVSEGGQPMVADFGVVTVTGQGPAQAIDPRRLAHAAPEQIRGSHPTPATDVYALGSVLYSLLAAEDAFVRSTDASVVPVIARVTGEAPADLRAKGVPDQAATVVEKALAKDPGQRYSSAEEMGRALQQAEITLGQPMTAMTILGPAGSPRTATATAAPGAGPAGPPPTAGPSGPPPAGGPPGGGPPVARPPAAAAAKSKAPLIAAVVIVLALIGVGAFVLLGGDDGDDGREDVERADDGDDEEDPDEEPEEPVLALVAASDDTGAVTVDVPEAFATNGAPFPFTQGGITIDFADLVAAGDAAAFLAGFATEGVEATGIPVDDLAAAAGVATLDASQLLDLLTTTPFVNRPGATAEVCTAGAPVDRTTAGGFTGIEVRFAGCDGGANDMVVFAGLAADGTTGLVVQVLAAPGGDLDASTAAIIDSAIVDAGLL